MVGLLGFSHYFPRLSHVVTDGEAISGREMGITLLIRRHRREQHAAVGCEDKGRKRRGEGRKWEENTELTPTVWSRWSFGLGGRCQDGNDFQQEILKSKLLLTL